MKKFTPGPWKVIDRGASWELARFWIGTIGNDWHGPEEIAILSTEANVESNAILIAAAPEMYEALKIIFDFVEQEKPPFGCMARKKMIEALKKAEGKK